MLSVTFCLPHWALLPDPVSFPPFVFRGNRMEEGSVFFKGSMAEKTTESLLTFSEKKHVTFHFKLRSRNVPSTEAAPFQCLSFQLSHVTPGRGRSETGHIGSQNRGTDKSGRSPRPQAFPPRPELSFLPAAAGSGLCFLPHTPSPPLSSPLTSPLHHEERPLAASTNPLPSDSRLNGSTHLSSHLWRKGLLLARLPGLGASSVIPSQCMPAPPLPQ